MALGQAWRGGEPIGNDRAYFASAGSAVAEVGLGIPAGAPGSLIRFALPVLSRLAAHVPRLATYLRGSTDYLHFGRRTLYHGRPPPPVPRPVPPDPFPA